MDAIGYPHPSFKASSIGISDPIIFCNWIKQENKQIDPRFVLGPDDVVPYLHTPKLPAIDSHSFFFRPNYGGVSLSKSANLMTSISDISGAIFDQKTGQLILYGKKDLPLPPMNLDDLAVAVCSVYGLGGKAPQDPGISMDHDPNSLNKKHSRMVVTYYGETQNTRFGQVMFEADRLLKNLILGKDNETGKKFKAHVQGYRNLLDRYARDGRPPSTWTWRMWFVPEKITLTESQDGTSMTFDQVRMQVLTETKFRGRTQDDHAAEKFADHLTRNYDSYANEFAILHDLKRLGRITAVVKWMKEQNIPIDLSFFKSHVPQFVATPLETPQIKIVEHGFAQISGGVVYHLDANNFAKVTSSYPSQAKDEILQARPHEENLSWNFGRDYTAVAQTVAKSLKVGDVTKTFIDMSFPLPGPFPLALVRTYNSFNTDRSGFGIGWDITPAKLRFPSVKQWMHFSDETVHQAHAEVFVCIEGKETPYKIFSIDGSGRPLYRTEGQPFYLVENGEGTFSLFKQHIEFLFNSDGRLTRINNSRGVIIDYAYNAGQLVSISYKGKKAIHLKYAGNQIIRAIGPGNKVIDYDYTPEGQLKTVRDSAGVLATYDYDQDHRLTAIFDAKGDPIFETQYDIYSNLSLNFY